jgi:hypothetical protein
MHEVQIPLLWELTQVLKPHWIKIGDEYVPQTES